MQNITKEAVNNIIENVIYVIKQELRDTVGYNLDKREGFDWQISAESDASGLYYNSKRVEEFDKVEYDKSELKEKLKSIISPIASEFVNRVVSVLK